jgi:hydrogenase maturation protease
MHPLSRLPPPDRRRLAARVLCLGNELLADDALGAAVAAELAPQVPEGVEVVFTPLTGFYLLEYLLDSPRLIVVDTVVSGAAPPGAIRALREEDLQTPPGGSPHYVGLFEPLAAARALGLAVPGEITLLVVEAADCSTVGGGMHPAVKAAVPRVVRRVLALLNGAGG